MTASFLYALPENVTLQQEAAVARGLRSLFPEFEFEPREGAFLTGEIMPINGQISGDRSWVEDLPRLTVLEVKAAFAGLLVDALAGA